MIVISEDIKDAVSTDMKSRQDNQDFLISGTRIANKGRYGDLKDLTENVQLDDNDVFIYPAGVNILNNLADLWSMVNYHQQYLVPPYKLKRDYYKGRHQKIIWQPKKDIGKPDNRDVVNLPKKLVNTFNGFFAGIPVNITYQEDGEPNDEINEAIGEFLKSNDYEDVFSEASRFADIYGRSYLHAYMDEDSQLRFTATTPIDTFVVYDDTVQHKPLFAVRYSYRGGMMYGTLITPDGDYEFNDKGGDRTTSITNTDDNGQLSKADTRAYGIMPVIEFEENRERLGLFDDVISLIDAIDKGFSEKDDDVDYFSDAYLAITGIKLTKEQLKMIHEQRIFNLYQSDDTNPDAAIKPEVQFLNKESDDATQEHFLDRAIDLVYQISQVVNLNDSNFNMSADAASGVAILNRYQPMKSMADTKARKFNAVLRKLFTIMFKVNDISGDPENLTFKYTQNIPQNVAEAADVVQKLNGIASDKTTLSFVPGVDDPQKELDQKKQDVATDKDTTKGVVDDALTDQQKAGVKNADNAADAAEDQPTDQSGQSGR